LRIRTLPVGPRLATFIGALLLALAAFAGSLALDGHREVAEAGAQTAAVTCAKTASDTTVAPGQSFTYTNVCTINDVASDATAWRAIQSDTWPTNFTQTATTCDSSVSAPFANSNTATASRCGYTPANTPDAVGGTFTMVVTGSFSAAACGTTVANTSSINYLNTNNPPGTAVGDESNIENVTVNCDPEISCVKTASETIVNPGQSFTYTTTCTIETAAADSQAQIRDVLPANFVITNNTCPSDGSAGTSTSEDAQTRRCNWDIAQTPDNVGDEFSMVTTGSFTDAECGNTINNQSTARYGPTGNAASDTSDDVDVTVACAAITCVKTTSDSAVDATQSFTYTTTCTIDSLPANPTNWRSFIIDTLPTNFTKTGVNCPTSAAGDGVDGSVNAGQGRCNFNTSQTPDAVGGTFELEVTGFFTTAECGNTVQNDASGDYRDDTTEVGPKDTTDTVAVSVHCAEITCVKTTSEPVVDAGQSFSYTTTCTIDVLGADPTNHRAIIIDELPANFTKTNVTCPSSAGGGVDGSVNAGQARCNFNTAQTPDVVDGTFSLIVTGSFSTAACGTTVQNDAEGNYRDNTSQIGPKDTTPLVDVEVLCGEIDCEKTASEEFVLPGQELTYTTTCTITEAGGPNATAGIEDALPENFLVDSVTCEVNGSETGPGGLFGPPTTASCDFNAAQTPDDSGTFAMLVTGSFTGDECGNLVENTSGPNFYGSDTGSDNDAGPVSVAVVCPTAPDLDFDGEFDPDVDIELPPGDLDGDGDDDEGPLGGPRVGTGGTGIDQEDVAWQFAILAGITAVALGGAYVAHRRR
jgi:fimbrial isopeptide formation D2 family protein